MNIAVYHRTVPNAKNQEKIDLLRFFAQGARQLGESVIDVEDHNYRVAEVAVIQGWINHERNLKPHIQLRNQVIHEQLKNRRRVIAVDSNVFLYATPGNPLHYLRYSFDGVFPNTGIYCDTIINPIRWQKISHDLGISLKPYRTNGNHILLCLQRNGGWSMGNFDVADWTNRTIAQIRTTSTRPIVIRTHPGDKNSHLYLNKIQLSSGITISTNRNLIDDLQNCWAMVNHNSSPAVGGAIEGYPVFVTDPTKSQCQEIANTDLTQIENPLLPDRQRWVERLSMSHWNFNELQSGECWAHMRQFI